MKNIKHIKTRVVHDNDTGTSFLNDIEFFYERRKKHSGKICKISSGDSDGDWTTYDIQETEKIIGFCGKAGTCLAFILINV